jgi:hypothetical protein
MTRFLNPALTILLLLACPVVAWFLQPRWALLAVTVLLLAFLGSLGKQKNKLWRGALVDTRNKVSLSRFQTALWTVLVASALLTVALHNIRTEQVNPLDFSLPPELLVLLGISVTSLVGASIIKREKGRIKPEKASSEMALGRAHDTAPGNIVSVGTQLVAAEDPDHPSKTDDIVAKGLLATNGSPDQSSWMDLFSGEEVGSIGRLDLGKIQMFYFTIIVIFLYAVAVASLLPEGAGKVEVLPTLNEGMIALLGISHAAYLTNKTVPTTPTSRDT